MEGFEKNRNGMSLPQFATREHYIEDIEDIEDFADIRTQNLNRLSEFMSNINAQYRFNLNVKNLRAFLTG